MAQAKKGKRYTEGESRVYYNISAAERAHERALASGYRYSTIESVPGKHTLHVTGIRKYSRDCDLSER